MKKTTFLLGKWKLKIVKGSANSSRLSLPPGGIPASVPGTVHTDLLNGGYIPDPFYADNETKLEWVQECDWRYRTQFNLPPEFDLEKPILLVFEGLDTFTEIRLNGEQLGTTENMFQRYEFPVQKILKHKENVLEVVFHFASRRCRELEEQFGKLPVALSSARVYARKAQYSFGWDWGPSFPTMGIWRPVYLLQPDIAQIRTVRFHTLSLAEDSAQVQIDVELEGTPLPEATVQCKLENGEQHFSRKRKAGNQSKIVFRLRIDHPRLWWPNGEGEQHLYNLQIILQDRENRLLDTKSLRVGIRTVTLQTEENGKPAFRFFVNGRPIFARGANWIPADSFLPRVSQSKYRKLLLLARNAHMNMLRVWGGGIYEDNSFYQLCDELGLLVWQDFMFACGVYPHHREFLANIEEEFRQNINRLQHHPCIALWCGNNENEWGWVADQKKPVEQMPDFSIYHRQLPKIVSRHDPHRPYWPSSPFGSDAHPNDPRSGNRHQWEIWSMWQDYTSVKSDRSLFITEFGFQGPANRETLESALPEHSWHPQSELFEFHNKQVEGNERLFRFLAGHLPVQTIWADFLYLAQLNQGLALKTCLEHWRSRWPETSGSIIWQLNDCWPVTSWSLIDSALQPKLAYYFVKSAFLPQTVYFRELTDRLEVVVFNRSNTAFP
ncbi:MAG TPA: glycoside hydrolase family 2 protein, partial [Caldithrix sp.]|nr:glycoside hydrolase family 2 protein [Caldithrix sp.]